MAFDEQSSTAQANELLNLIYLTRSRASAAASAVGGSFVYQPGGVAKPGIYTTWAALYAAVNAAPGLKYVLLDPSFAPCTVPAGAWNLSNWLLQAQLVIAGGETTLTFEQGATVTGAWFDAFFVAFVSASTNPVMTVGQGDTIFLDTGASVTSNAGAAPFFRVTSPNEAAFILEVGAQLGDGNEPVLEVDAGAQAVLLLAGFDAQVNNDALSGGGNVFLELAPAAQYNPSQPAFTGQIGLTGQTIQGPSGQAASQANPSQPSYSFLNAPTLGFFEANGVLGLAGGVTVTTANAGAQTVSVGYQPSGGVTAIVVGTWNVQDAANNRTYGARSSCNLKAFVGVSVAGQQQTDGSGDAALNGAAVGFAISGGTLAVTFTPPAGYVGQLFWRVFLELVENEGP